MPADQPSRMDRIAALRSAFVEQLPQRVERMRAALAVLARAPSDQAAGEELHRLLHNLKGSGAAFGFNSLGAAAAEAEGFAAAGGAGEALDVLWLTRAVDGIEAIIEAIRLGAGPADEDPSGFVTITEHARAAPLDSGRLVYLCDDEREPLEMLAEQLACFGYQTRVFDDIEALRAAVLSQRPDCTVMDITFPGGRDLGTALISALRSEVAQPFVTIFLSSRDDFDARLNAVRAGGAAYVVKPPRALQIVGLLDELTGARAAEPYRILVVDDDPEVASYHCVILQEAGMVTRHVAEPARALQVLKEFRPDMVLMDMYMPGCLGSDLAGVIRQMPDYFALPIVYLSSETNRKKQFVAMRIGADGFMMKPVKADELVSAVAIRAERMRALRGLIARDSLTGLLNHTAVTQMLEALMAAADRRASPLAFVMIDIDTFKLVNDTHGHPVGDQVIIALARLLRHQLRRSDVVGRYGGEEFAVVLQDTPLEEAGAIIDKLRVMFSRIVFHAGSGEFSCTFSAGVAAYHSHLRFESLCEAADQALYRAKHQGRNQVVIDAGEQP